MSGVYFDYERGTFVPNTLKVFKERFEEFKSACKVEETEKPKNCPKKWWINSVAKSKADSLVSHLDHILNIVEVNENNFARYSAMKACILYESAIFIVEKSINSALQLLRKAHDLVWPLLPSSEVYWLYFNIVFKFATLLKGKNDEVEAIQVLEDSIRIYEKEKVPNVLYTTKDLFSLYIKIQPHKETKHSLESTVTKNYQLLIRLYVSKSDPVKYIRCEHFLLRRELNMKTMLPHEWIIRACVVAKILVSEHDFRNARHHLAVATLQFNKLPKTSLKKVEEKERLGKTELAISTSWINYGLMLLTESKLAILNKYCTGDASRPSDCEDVPQQKNDKDEVLAMMPEGFVSEASFNVYDEIVPGKNVKANVGVPPVKETKEHFIENTCNSSIIDKALLLFPQDVWSDNFSDALKKKCYLDLRFPGQVVNEIESSIPRSLIEVPGEAVAVFITLLPWIEMFKNSLDNAKHQLKFISFILDLNELYKTFAFFQPDPNQQYELHKERQTELERLAWLLKVEEDPTFLTQEVIVTKELSIVHYQLSQMNVKRVKELEEVEEVTRVDSGEVMKELLVPQQ